MRRKTYQCNTSLCTCHERPRWDKSLNDSSGNIHQSITEHDTVSSYFLSACDVHVFDQMKKTCSKVKIWKLPEDIDYSEKMVEWSWSRFLQQWHWKTLVSVKHMNESSWRLWVFNVHSFIINYAHLKNKICCSLREVFSLVHTCNLDFYCFS